VLVGRNVVVGAGMGLPADANYVST